MRAVGLELAEALEATGTGEGPLEGRLTSVLDADPRLRGALFRFVDVAPACRGGRDAARHLRALLAPIAAQSRPARAIATAARPPIAALTGRAALMAVRRGARRFIVAERVAGGRRRLSSLWRDGQAAAVDLLGEASVTAAEADAYAQRCGAALRELAAIYSDVPDRPRLERDGSGPLPRVHVAVKLSALSPVLLPAAPGFGAADAVGRLRPLLRDARDLGAHLHLDVESLDTRDIVLTALAELLAEPEFRSGPSCGIVVQAYLRSSGDQVERLLRLARQLDRTPPLLVRLVKGAYWDHEMVDADQHGWDPAVFTTKRETDRNFERLTLALLGARPAVRVAIGSHNVRSLAFAIAANRHLGADDGDLELQTLLGLGDALARVLVERELRVRVYCPFGDLVAGMAYLVRRMLENTANESFLRQMRAASVADLVEAP